MSWSNVTSWAIFVALGKQNEAKMLGAFDNECPLWIFTNDYRTDRHRHCSIS